MEIIKNWLLNDEKILWENITYSKFDDNYSLLIAILIFFFFYIIFFVALRSSDFIFLPMFNSIFLMVTSLFLFVISLKIYTFLKDKKNGQLKWKDFKKYQKFAILTNKRWIQKDLTVIYLEDTDDLVKNVEHYKDIVLVNLEAIKLIEFTERKELGKWNYFISLYFSYNKKKPKKSVLGAHFSSRIQSPILLDSLQSVLKSKHVEINQVSKNYKISQFYY